MNKTLINIAKFFFFLGLGVLLIWLAVKDKTDEELTNIKVAIQQANYFWIFISLIVSALSHFLRAVRWKILLKPLGHQPKTAITFYSLMVGYLANFALPRLGEITRCGFLAKYQKVPFNEGFGTVITERAIDVICLIILFFCILAFEFERISGITNDLFINSLSRKIHSLMENKTLLIVSLIILIMSIIIFYYFRKKIQNIVGGKVKGFIKGLWEGLKSVKDVETPWMFAFHTIGIWSLYILQVYCCFMAFPELSHLGITVAIVIMVFGSLGIIVVPGGTGAYQYIVIEILTSVYLISSTAAFAFAWVVWTAQFAIILALGLISLLLLALLKKE